MHFAMTLELRKYVTETGRLPDTFAEFAGARMDSIPFPPEGMTYAIDPATIEVKLIRKK